jgi:hypothetical protein
MGENMGSTNRVRGLVAALALIALVVAGVAIALRRSESEGEQAKTAFANAREKYAEGEIEHPSPGGEETGGDGRESAESAELQRWFDDARTAPTGSVEPGAYSKAFTTLTSLSATSGAWGEITRVPYDADDPDYRDFFSNSSGGSGLVTGRVVGLAIGKDGVVYAAAANGGVWRSKTGAGGWEPIADKLPSLSAGDLTIDGSGALWFATGESNTGATSYVGSGVYRLANPATGTFSPSDRIGGEELESTTIHHLRFAGDTVYAATLRGVYSHGISGSASTAWQQRWAPNPDYLPGGSLSAAQNAAYKNIVNDIAIDPKDPRHLIVAAGWRSGDTYNGFYESRDGGTTFTRTNPTGALSATDVGYLTFAFAADGSKLYALNQSIKLINQATGTKASNTVLDGIYVSNTGNPAGPWNKIADSSKLANSGSALKPAESGKGYAPGVQAWYNQFLAVDPADPNHLYAGLEEVFETRKGGSTWTTPGPYWNFGFSCWQPDALYAPNGGRGCPQTTHPDQHAAAIGTVGGKPYVYVGNDGGVYRRPVAGKTDASGHATDWQSLNDGTMDALQYYYASVGRLQSVDAQRPDLGTGDSVLVSGGLQDNGTSLLRPGAPKMVSDFGGDGMDVAVDPQDGCNIVASYASLTLWSTRTCANPGPSHPNAFLDRSDATSVDVSPPDINAQFVAPFEASATNPNRWLAGGNSLWYQDKGWDITSPSQWTKVFTLDAAGQTFTAVAYSGNHALASWCGPCSNSGTAAFRRGVVVGTFDPAASKWSFKPVDLDGNGIPNRWIMGLGIDPNNDKHLVLGVNGFNRKFSEGPGAGIKHVFETTDGGTTWTDISANMPDVPVNDLAVLPSGGIVAATDLGVIVRPSGSTGWKRVGAGLPVTTVMDLTVGPDGNLYAATHGRGIWRIPAAGL